MPGAKKEKKVRGFFQAFVSAYFQFCRDEFGEEPSFDGSAPRDLAAIYDAIESKCNARQMIFTEELGVRSFKVFLEYCRKDGWLAENFLLFNLNRQKDKIFFKIKQDLDGKRNPEASKPKHFANHKTAGQDKFAERLRGRLDELQRSGEEDH